MRGDRIDLAASRTPPKTLCEAPAQNSLRKVDARRFELIEKAARNAPNARNRAPYESGERARALSNCDGAEL